MAISTVKIADTMEWAKRLNFERRSGIGNSLEPALTSAKMVQQTILGPPFVWWWNTEDLAFSCNPTLGTATITNIVLTANVVTITAANTFAAGQEIVPSGITTATFLNGQALVLQTVSSTQITANFVHADYVSAADTGTLTATTTQDYSVVSPEFSHIRHAAVFDTSQTPNKWYELEVKNNLSLDTVQARPRYISPQAEDGAGNITFRVMPSPNLAYPVNINVQKAAPALTSLNQTWAPIPDFMQYVYNWGFLTFMYMFADDSRFGYASQKFTSSLLSRAEGLSELERNTFLNNWNDLTSNQQMKMQQGVQARGV
jgi:hypothetical protein